MSANNIKNLTLYFIRHGKTFFNTTMQVQGCCDSLLTDEGRRQAILTGQALKDIPFAGAYCGDLGRHRATARHILAENLHESPGLVECEELREWNFGGYEGRDDELMWSPLFEKFGLAFDHEFTEFTKLNSILGDRGICEEIANNDLLGLAEHYDDILARINKAVCRVIEDMDGTAGRNVLIVSSGNLLPTILYQLIPGQYHGEVLDNCSVTALGFHEGRYELLMLADTSHLSDIQPPLHDE